MFLRVPKNTGTASGVWKRPHCLSLGWRSFVESPCTHVGRQVSADTRSFGETGAVQLAIAQSMPYGLQGLCV